jgi:hypothetical protein
VAEAAGGLAVAGRQLRRGLRTGGPTAAAAAWHGEPRRRPPPAPRRNGPMLRELVELSRIAGIGRLPQKSELTGSERRALFGSAPPVSTVLRIPLRGMRLRRTVDPGASAGPAGLTARARPKARPDSRAANLSNLDFYKGFIWMVAT